MFNLVSAFPGANGCGAGGWEGGTSTGGGSGATKPAFGNPKPAFDFSKPGFVAPKPGLGAGGAEKGQRIAGREGAKAAKIRGFIGGLGANAGICADQQEVWGAYFPGFSRFQGGFVQKPSVSSGIFARSAKVFHSRRFRLNG